MAVDAADRVPAGHLDLLAAEGLYGLAGPPERGGLGADPATACRVIETLAGGCLATAFVWLQHHGVVRAVAAEGAGGPGATWLEPLCRGERRAGVALGGTLPGAPLRARPVRGGYLLEGLSPWATGWDLIDVVHVAARDPRDNIVMALLDAEAGPALSAEPLHMVAVNASRTVQLRFDGQFVAADRVTGIAPYRAWQAADVMRLRPNGSLALGVAARCCRLIGPSPLDRELAAGGPPSTPPPILPPPTPLTPPPTPPTPPPTRPASAWAQMPCRPPGQTQRSSPPGQPPPWLRRRAAAASWPGSTRSGWPASRSSYWSSAPGRRSRNAWSAA
jgi:alkylation response protein AidB-like acyl-CoA dehydrogenase